MDGKTIALIALIVTIVFFVPFYPFRLIKKIVFYLFKFLPLPIKFDDIGGIPVFGMRLYNVKIPLGAAGTIEAEELHLKLRFFRLLLLKRPAINPLTLYRPVITLTQAKKDIEGLWFLIPVDVIKSAVGVLFKNLTGLNIIRIYGGTVVIKGKRSDTTIKDVNGLFSSHGNVVKVRRLSCFVGNGNLEIHYPKTGAVNEGRLAVRRMRLEDLAALKVPRFLTGPVNIEGSMTGDMGELEIIGHISSPSLFMRDVAIQDFRSPLHFKGTTLTLERMEGRIGDYKISGSLVNDVVTDISDLRLAGGGNGTGSQEILKMLALKPFISRSVLDADVRLWGNLNEFTAFQADIHLKLKNTEIDFSQVGEGTMAGFPLAPIPEGYMHLTMSDGNLYFEDCKVSSGKLDITAVGKIIMNFDVEADKVTRSQFEMRFEGATEDLQDVATVFGNNTISVTGSLKASFEFYADYSNRFHALEGKGNFDARDVRFKRLPLPASFPRLPKNMQTEDSSALQFDRLVFDVFLQKEGFGFSNLDCSGKLLNIVGNGALKFFENDLLMNGMISMNESALGEHSFLKKLPFADFLVKKMKVAFKVDGKIAKPRLHIKKPGSAVETYNLSPPLLKERSKDADGDVDVDSERDRKE